MGRKARGGLLEVARAAEGPVQPKVRRLRVDERAEGSALACSLDGLALAQQRKDLDGEQRHLFRRGQLGKDLGEQRGYLGEASCGQVGLDAVGPHRQVVGVAVQPSLVERVQHRHNTSTRAVQCGAV